jgi:hypothetical protein
MSVNVVPPREIPPALTSPTEVAVPPSDAPDTPAEVVPSQLAALDSECGDGIAPPGPARRRALLTLAARVLAALRPTGAADTTPAAARVSSGGLKGVPGSDIVRRCPSFPPSCLVVLTRPRQIGFLCAEGQLPRLRALRLAAELVGAGLLTAVPLPPLLGPAPAAARDSVRLDKTDAAAAAAAGTAATDTDPVRAALGEGVFCDAAAALYEFAPAVAAEQAAAGGGGGGTGGGQAVLVPKRVRDFVDSDSVRVFKFSKPEKRGSSGNEFAVRRSRRCGR